MPTEAKGIAYRQIDFLFPRRIGNVIQVAIRIGSLVMDGRGQNAFPHGLNTEDDLNAPVAPIMCPVMDLVEEIGIL